MSTKQRSEAKYTTPDEARAALARVSDAATKAREELLNRQAELAALEEEAGTRLFNARLNSDTDEETKVESDIDIARKAVDTAQRIVDASEGAIRTAQKAVYTADAHELREQAAQIMVDVRPRLAATRKLLDALAEAEDVHAMPEPHAAPSGAVATGSWRRSRTGTMLAEVIERERHAAHLEARAGAVSPPSLLVGLPDVAWHLGNPGVIEAAIPLKVGGRSYIDDATARLMGKPVPEEHPTPSRAEIVRRFVAPWGIE
jgi:hypothetical protein